MIGLAAICTFFFLSTGTMSMQQTTGTEENQAALSDPSGGVEYAVERGRADPFAPLDRRSNAPQAAWTPEKIMLAPRDLDLSQLLLGGIVWSTKRPLAVINQSLVGVNDTVSGWTVVDIQRDKVVVEMEGRKEILKMKVSFFDKKAGNAKASE